MSQRRRGSSFPPPPPASTAPMAPLGSLDEGMNDGTRTTPIGLGMYGEYASSAYTARIPTGAPRFYSLARYALGASPYGRKNSYIRWVDDRGMRNGSRASELEEAVFVPTTPLSGPIINDAKWDHGELELLSYDRVRFRVPKDVFREQTFGLKWNVPPGQQVLTAEFKVEFETSDVVRAYLALMGKKTSVPLAPTLTDADFDVLGLCNFPYGSQALSNLVLFVNKWTIRDDVQVDVANQTSASNMWYAPNQTQSSRNPRQHRALDQVLPTEYHDIVDLVLSRIIDLNSWPESALTRYRNWWDNPNDFRLDLCMVAGICMERKRQRERYDLGLASPEDVYA